MTSQKGSSRDQVEQRLLSFLCEAANETEAREALARLLKKYSWSEADRDILFRAIAELLALDSRHIREELPAALTRSGFPDMNCEIVWKPSQLRREEARRLALRLIEMKK